MGHNLGLKLTISVAAIALIVVRVLWPDLKVDAVTLGLLAVCILPWLSTLIKSAEFPGGWKVEFQEVKAAGDKITKGATAAETAEPAPRPSYVEIAERDPNLALVGLRIEIERRLRTLAERHHIHPDRSMMRLFEELRRRGVLNDPSVSGLQELVMAGNQAAHGAFVEPQAANWAIDYGPQVLAVLDAKLRDSSPDAV